MSDNAFAPQVDTGGALERVSDQNAAPTAPPAASDAVSPENTAPAALPADYDGYAHAGTDGEEAGPEVPEGLEVDEAVMGEFKEYAAANGFTRQQVQDLLNLQSKAGLRALESMSMARQGWRREIAADPDFGGEMLPRTITEANQVLKSYDKDGSLAALLTESGFGDHPAVIRALARIGRALNREDKVLSSRTAGAQPDTPLYDKLWPAR